MGAAAESTDRALQTPLNHTATRQPSAACLNAKWGLFLELPSSLASSLHLRVKSPVSSQPGPPLWPRSASLCGSVCRPAAHPQIIITIKHCFPNKTISLPLILCQSLFLFTSGHSNPGTAITWGKTQARLKISLCSVYEDGNV